MKGQQVLKSLLLPVSVRQRTRQRSEGRVDCEVADGMLIYRQFVNQLYNYQQILMACHRIAYFQFITLTTQHWQSMRMDLHCNG